MPCIWGNHNNNQVFLDVAIIPEIPEDPTNLNVVVMRALIDTGATSTCITETAANDLGLQPIGKVPVHGVSGIEDHNNYLFHVGFYLASPGNKGSAEMSVQYLTKPIQGLGFVSGGQYQVLLGMDVLGLGSLKIEGNGTFSYSF